jgi:hypothetical protein
MQILTGSVFDLGEELVTLLAQSLIETQTPTQGIGVPLARLGLFFWPRHASLGLQFVGFRDHSVATTTKRLTLAGKIDAVLKLSVVVSVLLASSSVGYYYLVHLPHRDAQFEPERVLERLRAAAKKRAEEELFFFEQQASERRAAEQQAVEERQALEKADRYQACLSRATDNYNASRLVACNRPREKIIKDRDNCIELGFSEKVCAMAHVVREASPNCALPRAVALSLDAEVEKARDRCVEEAKIGLR